MKTGRTLLLLAVITAFGCAQKNANVQGGPMALDICGARKVENPTDEQIRSELGGLSTKKEDSFAILGSSDMTYIQVGGDKSVGFYLEYQEGSVDAHFRAADAKLTLEQVVSAFIAYRDAKPGWQNAFTFEKITW